MWFHSLEPLEGTTWPQLQNLFRQRYSKLGNTHEQLFHAWGSFTFNENSETIDSYVIQRRQVATLLGYGEPQILEVFKNTLPTKLYWILSPIEDIRQVVDTAKRILTKAMLDKQLTDQTSTSPFMSIRDGTERKVSFNTGDELGDKIDMLTVVMSRLGAKDSHEKRPFKPQIYKSRGQNRSYNQGSYQNKPDSRNRGQYTSSRPRQKNWGSNFEETLEDMENKIIEKHTEMTEIMIIIEAGIGQEKGYFQEIMVAIELGIQVTVDQGQDLEVAQIEIG